jgi:hypothetical protein
MNHSGTYNKRMQVLAYVFTFLLLCGALPALGWINKTLELHISNEVQTLMVGGLLGLFQDLTKKIFRIESQPQQREKATD